jgi:hypothetical protein
MVTDKNGKELQVGDEIIVRGKVIAAPMDLQEDGKGVLQIKWSSPGLPLLDYVLSQTVEKAE